jgi:hypothetical protein
MHMRQKPDRYSCGVALEGRLGQAYDEEAFRYFLAIERKRSERSRRPLLVALVDLTEQPNASVRIDPIFGPKLFSGLWRCLRETDFVGWYRDERVAGAVLTQPADGPQTEIRCLIGQRISRALCEVLPSDVAHRLRVRVYQLRPRQKS